ncbi:VOC family protein [Guptibacillus algicola]|uniref:VOC family protein n=1 Tax=Guptibacillus algicola TaxID=225844 RepID=UPI001CD7EE38|nr:VOC family protein [Alkalihalobacillus algicola]MCA0987196.1 VOC family protein [Alkalihalobacillus algicola]
MAFQANQVYINIPVKDVDQSVSFFSELGFEFNAEYTDKNAACLIINDRTFVMLLVEEYFKSFTKKAIVNAKESTESILAIAVNNKDEVDSLVKKALDYGGEAPSDPVDHGFMYAASFQDLDGHLWEVMSMENKV